jgi:glucose-6-phosphate isomerase
VLSKFGLVPAAAMGLDVKRLLETAHQMERACGPDVPPAENPGVQLGVAIIRVPGVTPESGLKTASRAIHHGYSRPS